MARAGEDDLIARHFAPWAGPGGLGLLDDAALVKVPNGCEMVVTVDAVVSGIHFLLDDPPASIARKALGVNLSDLAAKGADPIGFVLALALPDAWTEEWLSAFAGELGAFGQRSACPLLGGDTVRAAGPLSIAITAFGSVPAGRMVRRTTARSGDLVAVTGTIGDAALGLLLCRGDRSGWADSLPAEHRGHLEDRYRHPRPRLALAPALRDHASAAMDISDGFSGDLAKLLRVSGVGGEVELDRVPLSTAARAALAADPSLMPVVMGGGDDYEIVLTAQPDAMGALVGEAARLALALTIVGCVTGEGGDLVLNGPGGRAAFEPRAYAHFGERP